MPYIYFVCSNLHVRKDFDPFQCLLNIQPMKGMCWVSKATDVVTKSCFVGLNSVEFYRYLIIQLQVKFDYLDFDMHADGTSGGCIYDSMTLLDR